MSEKGAIKKSTAQAICDAVKVKEGTTEGVPFKDVAERILALPTASGESKFIQLVERTLTEITAEDLAGATKIGRYAFYAYNTLTSITFPDTITEIGERAFYECKGLTSSIVLPPNLQTLKDRAFYQTNITGNIVFPSTLTTFESTVFAYSKIKGVVVNDAITKLPSNAFYECSQLETITLPNTLTEVGSQGFAYCKIKEITLPASMTYIGNSCFYSCHYLNTVTILATTPPTIGTGIFNNVSSLARIIVPAGCGEAYRTATNWAAYADYIEEATV